MRHEIPVQPGSIEVSLHDRLRIALAERVQDVRHVVGDGGQGVGRQRGSVGTGHVHAADSALPRRGSEPGHGIDHQPRGVLVVRLLAPGQVWNDHVHDQGIAELERDGQRGALEYLVREGEVNIFIASAAVGLSVDFHALNRFLFVFCVVGAWCRATGLLVLSPILLLTELAAVRRLSAPNAGFGPVGGAAWIGAAFRHSGDCGGKRWG